MENGGLSKFLNKGNHPGVVCQTSGYSWMGYKLIWPLLSTAYTSSLTSFMEWSMTEGEDAVE